MEFTNITSLINKTQMHPRICWYQLFLRLERPLTVPTLLQYPKQAWLQHHVSGKANEIILFYNLQSIQLRGQETPVFAFFKTPISFLLLSTSFFNFNTVNLQIGVDLSKTKTIYPKPLPSLKGNTAAWTFFRNSKVADPLSE